jgi:hypothetical protein
MRYCVVLLFLLTIFCPLFHGCSQEKKSDETILVCVANKTISVNEFIRRAELTPRPFYCSGNSAKDKNIILNTLVAEKMLVLDQYEKNPDKVEDEGLQYYLNGIREQAMRWALYRVKILNTITVDSASLNKNFLMAGIVYRLKYYTIYDTNVVKNSFINKQSFEQVFQERLGTAPIPSKTIRWQDQENLAVHNALFTKIIPPGTMIGPIELAGEGYLVCKIDSVKEIKTVTLQDVKEREQLVTERLKRRKAAVAWLHYINQLMESKKITFFKETFDRVASLFEEIYFSSESEPTAISGQNDHHAALTSNQQLLSSLFYKIDERIWTVAAFKRLIMAHPLIYRTSELSRENYKYHFRKAIIDLMGDYFLTQEAYNMDLDKDSHVIRTVSMWQDALLAKAITSEYLEAVKRRDDYNPNLMKGNYTYLDIYLDSLKTKFCNRLQLNMNAYNRIRLTQSSMIALQSLQPHALAVPPFPQLTQDDTITEYIRDQ